MRLNPTIGLVLSLCLPALPAQTTQHYFVDAGIGSDTNTGSSASPFRSITKAVSIAVQNAVVHVRPGTYSQSATGESFTIGIGTGGTAHQNVKILGTDPATCILEFASTAATASYYLQVWRGATNIEIANLTMQNGSAAPWYAAAIGLDCDGLHLHHCIIRNCTSGLIAWGGSKNTNIHDNIFDNCGVTLRFRQSTINGAIDNRLHHNLITGNSGFHAISLSSNDSTQTIVNNLVVMANGIGFDLGSAAAGTVFENNCAYQNTTNYNSTTGISKSNLSADPEFVDAANGDYRIKTSSPCVEAGYPAQPLVVNDFYGNARVSDADNDFRAVPDIGIHEVEGLKLAVSNWGQGRTTTFSLSAPNPLLLSYLYLSIQPASLVADPFGLIGIDLTPGMAYLIGIPTVPGTISLAIPTNPSLQNLPVWFQAFGLTNTFSFKPSGRLDQRL